MQFKLETPEHQRTAIRSVVEMLLYPSFGVPLVFLWPPYDDSEPIRRCDKGVTKLYASGNRCSSANEAGFTCSRTAVHGKINLCSFLMQ